MNYFIDKIYNGITCRTVGNFDDFKYYLQITLQQNFILTDLGRIKIIDVSTNLFGLWLHHQLRM